MGADRTSENANGLLRQYFPKASDLSVHPADHLQHVSVEMNQRPRRVLHWQTPEQIVQRYLEVSHEGVGRLTGS